MGTNFDGDPQRFRKNSAEQLARILDAQVPPSGHPAHAAFENFALALSLIPGLRSWNSSEKHNLLEIIQAQAGRDEMRYLHLLQTHDKLRAAILKVGSSR